MNNQIFKKIISFALICIFAFGCFPLTAFASDQNEVHTFTSANGETVEYYVDAEGHEYVYQNGEKRYVLLPLEKYRVTDEATIALANSSYQSTVTTSASPIYSTNGYVIISTLFNSTIYFPATTGYLPFPANADCLRLNTSKHTPWYVSNKLHVHIYVISRDDGSIYDYHYFDQNCTITQAYTLSGRFAAKVNIAVVSVGDMTSCNLAVTATAG